MFLSLQKRNRAGVGRNYVDREGSKEGYKGKSKISASGSDKKTFQDRIFRRRPGNKDIDGIGQGTSIMHQRYDSFKIGKGWYQILHLIYNHMHRIIKYVKIN